MRESAPLVSIPPLAAVILGAGMSRRMGQPKLVLPWGNRTVIGHIVEVLHAGGVSQITLITGAARDLVEQAVDGLNVKTVYNPEYQTSEMLESLKLGLAAQAGDIRAALVVLGDQPAINAEVVGAVVNHYRHTMARLVAPSYQHRRGHPWLVTRDLWQEIQALRPEQTLRDFLNQHANEIAYVTVETPAVISDIDTPQDYSREKPPTS